jgi:hypothetical protein
LSHAQPGSTILDSSLASAAHFRRYPKRNS